MSVFYCLNEYVFGIGACFGDEQKETLSNESRHHLRNIHFQAESYMRSEILIKYLQQIKSLVQHKASVCKLHLGQNPLKMLVPNLVCLILT